MLDIASEGAVFWLFLIHEWEKPARLQQEGAQCIISLSVV